MRRYLTPRLLIIVLLIVIWALNAWNFNEEFKPHHTPPIPAAPKIAFIGNSLTLHEPNPLHGWQGNYGMAASDQNHDYAHLLTRQLKLHPAQAYIRNFYPFETDGAVAKLHVKSLDKLFEKRPDITILQLGDNVNGINPFQLYNFRVNYGALVASAVRHPGHVYCVSTWWESPIKDYIIKQQCTANGGIYVYIGDIFTNPLNTDRKTVDFPNDSIDTHPKNWGMKAISERLGGEILKHSGFALY